jgi:hypothetical protein
MLGHYDEISNATLISQPQAMQLLLDVKYLTMLLVPRDNKVMHNSGLLLGFITEEMVYELFNKDHRSGFNDQICRMFTVFRMWFFTVFLPVQVVVELRYFK